MEYKFINRELSWLAFNYRILDEARNKQVPLFERLKFLAISASNLDEFFMVRVASVYDDLLDGSTKKDISLKTPKEALEEILDEAHRFVNLQYSTFNRSLLPVLQDQGLCFCRIAQLDDEERRFVSDYYHTHVEAVLTPMAVDASRPFPLIQNKSLNIACLLERDGERHYATIQVPSVLDRFILLPNQSKTYVLLEDMIQMHLFEIFDGYTIVSHGCYRITRNAGFDLDEDETENLLTEVEQKLKKRRTGDPVRLEVEASLDEGIYHFLKQELGIKKNQIFYVHGPLDLTFLFKFYGVAGTEHLKFEPFKPQKPLMFEEGISIFDQIKEKDRFIHLPYESFDPVLDFVKEASVDPQVLAIKQTLYRVSGHSPIIAALEKAAENGKQVTVLVELKARFDEENNIIWAKKLEKAGCHVIYGLLGLKTHSKITLVVRKEEEGICRYVHLGTGNYNDSTAKIYTDLGIFTCDEAIGEDASALFNMISGYSKPRQWHQLAIAPYWLRDKFYALIDREIRFGKEGHIIAKMNSLIDKGMMEKVYEAADAGVKVDLIVRGICGLKPHQNITVRSIVGQFLEHSRIYYFRNGGNEEYYASSADWMGRNLNRRVEILFPILDKDIQGRVRQILDAQMRDTLRASVMDEDGEYHHIDLRGKERFDSQQYFIDFHKQTSQDAKMHSQQQFIPRMKLEENEP